MPKRQGSERRRRSPLAAVERAFSDAIDRLIAGIPQHSKLKRLAAEGRLRINPTTVALEAGRSRTMIALENCRLPEIRNRILAAQRSKDITAPRTASEVIVRLREQVNTLRAELAASMESQQRHFLAREKAEREAAQWRDALRRMQDHAVDDAKVTPIRGKK